MAQEKKNMDELLNHGAIFNSKIKFLARVYLLKKKGTFDEEKALRNNKRLAIIVDEDPLFLIETCGPFFLKYGKLIKERKWDEFIKMEFSDEKKIYKSTEDGADKTDDTMRGHIQFIKKIFLDSTEKEQKSIGDAITDMLSSYCQYALHIKNSEQ